MDKLKELEAQRAKAQADAETLLYEPDGESRDLSDEERASVDELLSRIEDMDERLEVMRADEERFKAVARSKARLQEHSGRRVPSPEPTMQADRAERTIPATARRWGSLQAFKGPDGELGAYRFGVWVANCLNVPWARERARQQGLEARTTMTEGVNTQGGFLVPDEFSRTIIELLEQYGVFRQNARIVQMGSDHIKIPRRTGGLTPYFIGESEAITESNKTWDHVTLTAKKLGVLSVISNELGEDAIVNMADDLAREAAYQMAYYEDICGFTANGQGTYAGMVGAGPAITNVNGVDEGGGVEVNTGDLPSEAVLGDFNGVVARLPGYADNANAKWYCNRNVWAHMQRLEAAAGGNTGVMLQDGFRRPMFLGYPVVQTQVMDTGSAVSQVLAILGDLSQAATMGVRKGITMGVSASALNAFEQDELVLRWVERFDIKVHDVGTATVAGPIVALVGAAA